MKTTNLSGLLLILAFFMGCSGHKQQQETANTETFSTDTTPPSQNIFYFNGDFTYYADAATLRDCVSGAIIPIAMKGEYLNVEKKYTGMNPSPMEAINCDVMGYLIDKGADEEGPAQQLLITELIDFDRTVSCNPDAVITDGVYASYSPDEKTAKTKISLTFNTDYTFQCITYQLSPVKLMSEFRGQWFRTAEENLVLLFNDEVLYEGTIDFTNMHLTLQNEYEQEVVFRKGI